MTADRRDDAGDIARALAVRIRSLVQELLPHGREHRGEWVALNPTRGDRTPGSFAIHLDGIKAGVWADFRTGDRGDALDLVAYVKYGGNLRDALEWSRGFLGLESGPIPPDVRRAIAPPADDAARAAEEAKRRAAALKIWLAAQPALRGTPADHYLAGRGLDLARLGRQPRALRYHPALWNVEAGARLPALVAAVTNDAGVHTATHRIWLERRAGGWGKAPLLHPKLSLGVVAGACIRLWRGASGKSLKDAPPGDCVAIAEGIETGLAVALACPELRVLSAVSLANIGNLALPAAIGEVIICADNDVGNDQAASLVQRAVRRYQAEGRRVRLAMPEVPGADWNDILQLVEG
jgi:hypothetical protein